MDVQKIYILKFSRSQKSTEYTAFSHKIVFNGVWGALRPSSKRLYTVLKSFAYPGIYANIGGDLFNSDGETCIDCDDGGFSFVPQSTLANMGDNLPTLAELCGIAERTLRASREQLVEWGLMSVYDGEALSGVALPHDCGFYAPEVLQWVVAAEQPSPQSKARAKRFITAVRRIAEHRDTLPGGGLFVASTQ